MEILLDFEVGTRFPMGNDNTVWRVLSIDEAAQTALVIADDIVCGKPYNEED